MIFRQVACWEWFSQPQKIKQPQVKGNVSSYLYNIYFKVIYEFCSKLRNIFDVKWNMWPFHTSLILNISSSRLSSLQTTFVHASTKPYYWKTHPIFFEISILRSWARPFYLKTYSWLPRNSKIDFWMRFPSEKVCLINNQESWFRMSFPAIRSCK